MFTPRYTITEKLLATIKHINSLVIELNHRRFSHPVLASLEKSARDLSTFASTSIEGNPLPLTEVKKILKSSPAHIRDSEKEVLNYNLALTNLDKNLKNGKLKVSLQLILQIHRQVMQGLLPKSETGLLRQKPVVVNDPRTGQIVYIPPDDIDVRSLIMNLLEFILDNQGKIDPLILAGIFHRQMVLIHPFMDGNGRVTRLATKVLLAQMEVNTFKLFSFENYYNQNVTRYFQSVGERGNYYELAGTIDFTHWLEYFTEGIVDELLRVQKILPPVITTPETTLQPHLTRLLKYLQANGFIADRDYAKLVSRAKSTRALDFKKLIKLGLIERKGRGKATYYVLRSMESLAGEKQKS